MLCIFRSVAVLVVLLASTSKVLADNTVVWINVDGLRGDYAAKADAPFLQKLIAEGATSTQLKPIFPSLTFPTHVAMATGRGVDGHGVPGNSFFDPETGEMHRFPAESKLVRAEAIWSTATRQGVRTAVVDWPMSHRQQDLPHPSAYFGQRYERGFSDADRLDNLLAHWKSDNVTRIDEPPLRLLMGYASRVDEVGHHHAIAGPEVLEAVADVDRQLAAVFDAAVRLFEFSAENDDELYFIVSTDHGMAAVETTIDLRELLGDLMSDDFRLVTGGSTGTLFLLGLDEAEKAERLDAMMKVLGSARGLRAWRAKDVPAKYGFSDESRIGEIVFAADAGYAFSGRGDQPYNAVPDGETYSTHGYAADQTDDMDGLLVIWRYRNSLGGVDLGEVDQRRLHPTVATLLGVEPAAGVTVKPVELD